MTKSSIRKDMVKEYGDKFIENYTLFKEGELCFCPEVGNSVTYVYEGQVFNFDGNDITPEQNRNDIQVFFDHLPSEYQSYNIGKHVDGILSTMLEGKDWEIKKDSEVYRYRDGKFYRVVRGYVFTTWLAEEEMTKKQIINRILQDVVLISLSPISDEADEDEEDDSDVTEEEEEVALETSAVILKKKDFPPLPKNEKKNPSTASSAIPFDGGIGITSVLRRRK